MKRILLLLVASLISSQGLQAVSCFEDCVLRGWTNPRAAKAKRIHFEVRVVYNPNAIDFKDEWVSSVVLTLGKQKVLFPKKALHGLWFLGPPEGVARSAGSSDEFLLYFRGGDGAKSYDVDFSVRDGRLLDRHIIPHAYSELEDSLLIFDKQGKVIYDGPCDRQGHPARTVQHSGIDTSR
jgi:hypothetical protein